LLDLHPIPYSERKLPREFGEHLHFAAAKFATDEGERLDSRDIQIK
jgi:hypothetical protein